MKRVLLALVVTALLHPAVASAVPDGGIELISRPSGLGALPFDGVNSASADRHALSANGCFVVFTSSNDVLSAADEDPFEQVFRVDRCSPGRPTVLVSATVDGVSGSDDSFSPSISADGTRVAFTTAARNLLPEGATVRYSVVLKDLATGAVVHAARGHGANSQLADAFNGVISGDGTAVAFQARGAVDAANATGPVGHDAVYVRYPAGSRTHMASVTSTGGPVVADRDFDVSFDGSAVAFTTSATGLVTGDAAGGDDDAYLARNVDSLPISVDWVSFTGGNTSGAQGADRVALSGDGTTVAFSTSRLWVSTCAATCGAADPVDGLVGPVTDPQIHGIGFPAGAGTPTHVFWTTDRALAAADTDTEDDLYVRDLAVLASPTGLAMPAGDVPGPVSSGDVRVGDVTVFGANALGLPGTDGVRGQVFARAGGTTELLSQAAGRPPRRGEVHDSSLETLHAVSAGGRYVSFHTSSAGLGAPVGDGFWDSQVLVRDVVGATTTLVSAGTGGVPADDDAYRSGIDDAGSRVVFASQATNLVPGPTGGRQHVYVRDLATGTTQVADRTADGSPSAAGADAGALAGDGTRVAFVSRSPDLPDADGKDHVYVLDLATGALELVDRTAGGAKGDQNANEVDLSSDGRTVAFVSTALNLGSGGMALPRVYVKDLRTGALTWASVPEGGDPNQQRARSVSISGDGSRVAWVEDTPGFGYGSDGDPHVFLRDLAGATTVLASPGGSANPAAEQQSGSLDATGTRLAFVERVPDARPMPYLRDLTAGTTVPLLEGRRFGGFGVSLSADGHCAALNSKSPDVLAAGTPSADFDHVYLRAIGGDCPVVAASPGGGGGGGGATDTTAPVLSRLSLTRKRFAVARPRRAAAAVRRGTAFRFRLSEDARTSIAIARALPGRRVGGRCRKPTAPRRGRPRCTRFVIRATLTLDRTVAGANRVAFSGRLGRRALARGRYRAALGAVDAAGNRSAPKRIGFRIVRPSRVSAGRAP